MSEDDKLKDFSNSILGDWEGAMDIFFEKVERKAKEKALTDLEVEKSLQRGYGDEVADSWIEWIGEVRE